MKAFARRFFVTVLCLICVFTAFSSVSYALNSEQIDREKPVTLTVTFQSDGVSVPGVEFSIYYVASIDEYNEYALTDDFSACATDFKNYLAVNKWNEAAKSLADYASEQGMRPYDKAMTDNEGQVVFNGNLPQGLYLITCKKTAYGDYKYSALPSLACLPEYDGVTCEYDVQIVAKAGRESVSSDEPPVNPPKKPKPPLPQTGMLWWPVPVMTVLGLLLIVLGIVDHRVKRKNEE